MTSRWKYYALGFLFVVFYGVPAVVRWLELFRVL